MRRCRVSIRGVDGITHTVEAEGSSLFEVAASAVALLRTEGWSDALTPNAVLQVEVLLPPIVHQVPLRAVERWLEGPSLSPKEAATKRELRGSPPFYARSKSISNGE